MAKTQDILEETVDTPNEQPKTSYKELHSKSFKQIASRKREPIVEPEESEPEEEVSQIEEKAEEVKERKQKLKKEDIVRETVEAVKESLDSERKSKEETETKEERRKAKQEEIQKLKEHTPAWVKEGRVPKTYEEIYEESKKAAIDEFEARLAERDEARRLAAEEEAENKSRNDAVNKRFEDDLNSRIKSDLDELYTEGKLPRIEDESDPSDEGVVAQKELFQLGMEMNNKRIAAGLPVITDIKRIFYENYEPPSEQPAGFDAPIMGNRPSNADTEDRTKYSDLHKKSFREIIQDGIKRARGG